jgi:hypothetical protein
MASMTATPSTARRGYREVALVGRTVLTALALLVVPRRYAEACVIVDMLVGASLLVPIAVIAPAG